MSGRFEKNLQTRGEFLQADFSKSAVSGRFEKKSPRWGGEFLHADFSKTAVSGRFEKNLQMGGNFCMQISVNLQ